jgi:hypothetical protein
MRLGFVKKGLHRYFAEAPGGPDVAFFFIVLAAIDLQLFNLECRPARRINNKSKH